MIIRPDQRFLLAHPAHFLALGFGTGLAPVAPGTVGTLLAFPLFHLLSEGVVSGMASGWGSALVLGAGSGMGFASERAGLEVAALLGLIAMLFMLGVWACGRTGRAMGIADHSSMVWDEVVAMLLILLIVPRGTGWWVAAFLLFRFFDVVKPPPIRHFDQTLKGGFGVMFDDILAAFYTLLVLAVGQRIISFLGSS